jgi:hypothetical protein
MIYMISITRNFEPQVRFIVDSIIAIIIIVAATVQEMNARPNNQLIIFFFIRYYVTTYIPFHVLIQVIHSS